MSLTMKATCGYENSWLLWFIKLAAIVVTALSIYSLDDLTIDTTSLADFYKKYLITWTFLECTFTNVIRFSIFEWASVDIITMIVIYFMFVMYFYVRQTEKRTVKVVVNCIIFIYKSRSKYFTNWGWLRMYKLMYCLISLYIGKFINFQNVGFSVNMKVKYVFFLICCQKIKQFLNVFNHNNLLLKHVMRLSRLNFQRYFPVHIERRFITQSEEQSPSDSNNTSLMNMLSYFLYSPQTNWLFK